MHWWLWVLVGVLALAGESISMALFLLYVAIAAFVAALLAILDIGPAAQVGVFVVFSLLLIGLVRPRMLHALAGRVPHRALTNQGRLVDRLATVTQTVTSDGGMVRIGNAEFWTARVTPPTQRIEVGSSVRIAYVDGLTAYVEPVAPIPEVAPAPGPPAATQMAREES
ncbi:MAG TPA: NfeD family protein [Chloroflexota bacterium]|jgi:membrane protein implicated in regulation of membrane protease activity|nr:NfeD family protein [Chloroflexota bacterium]